MAKRTIRRWKRWVGDVLVHMPSYFELHFEILAKEELAKLQRQFRIMEESRKSYTDEAQNILRKKR